MNELDAEVYWLLLTLSFTAVMWLPYIVNRIVELGVVPAFLDPYGHTGAEAPWANRMMAAHINAVENLVLFAPLVILVTIYDVSSVTTVLAAEVYFIARVIHFIVFTFAVPLLRIVSFLAGFAAQMVLLSALLAG